MRFEHDGKVIEINFRRQHEPVHVLDKDIAKHARRGRGWGKVMRIKRSKHPFTTVILSAVDNSKPPREWEIVAQAKVGCLPTDQFTIEDGRFWALKKIMHLIPKTMWEPMWKAYGNRRYDQLKKVAISGFSQHTSVPDATGNDHATA